MNKISKRFHIIEEKDGEYFDRVECDSYEEAKEILQQVNGNYIIVPESEVDDYIYLNINNNENGDVF